MPASSTKGLRGRLLTFADGADPEGYRYEADGLILIRDGLIEAVGPAAELLPRLPLGAAVDHYPDSLILPGLIDTHIHYPQTQVVASYGAQLLEWLQKYTFVEEQKYADPRHAEAGRTSSSTSSCATGPRPPRSTARSALNSVEAFFTEAERRRMRMIAGKVMMDRSAPESLLDTPEQGYRESRDLLARWHGRGRALYAITPRFAITSTEAQLEAAGALVREFPDVHVQIIWREPARDRDRQAVVPVGAHLHRNL